VVIGFDPADRPRANLFRMAMGIDESVTLVGPWSGLLDDRQDSVELVRPVVPDDPRTGWALVDRVSYSHRRPWPEAADGKGNSLSRRSPDAVGGRAASWIAPSPNPGETTFAALADMDLNGQIADEDLESLVLALRDASAYEHQQGAPAALAGDADEDGDLDYDDLDELAALIRASAEPVASAEEPDVEQRG
jgi:hypothetical protein